MKINGNIVQGIYKYVSGEEYTSGDFVVSGDSIYICDAESVKNIDPATDTEYQYYRPYPGSQIITASEFFENSDSEKYVSAQSIYGILQRYQFGLDITGVITDYIDENGDTTLDLSSITNNPIDNLMLTKELNRGMIKISHNLPQIIDGTVQGESFSTIFGFVNRNDDYQLILSQYTYKSSSTNYVRVQEMMSPLSGVSVYRYMSWKEGNFPNDGGAMSGWKNVFSYSKAIKSKLDALTMYYSTLGEQIRAKKASMSSFRFREVYTGSGSETRSGSKGGGRSTVTDLSNGVYTVCLQGTVDDKIYAESLTVRVDGSSYTVYLSKLSGSVEVSGSTLIVSGASIISIYGRENI